MSHEALIRDATASDARGIAHVLVDGWRATYAGLLPAAFLATFNYDQSEADTRELLGSLPPSSAAFVADDHGSIVGVALVRGESSGIEQFSAELDAIYVAASMQRQRIGSRLLQRIVGWLIDHGDRSMRLWVLRDNPYRRFYEGLGGELLPQERQDTFGEMTVTTVSYGWRSLDVLDDALGRVVSVGPGRMPNTRRH